MNADPREKVTSHALIVWSAAVCVYIAAIFSRTSLGGAGVEAMDRFSIDASRIAVFTAVQVGVYALAQIPAGILIDRRGPRFMLCAGALIMGIGQVIVAVTTSFGVAVAARVLIGAGDATTFLSVMRLLPLWFPPKKAPVFSQMSGALGQIGQFLSAVPFIALLHHQGWTRSFLLLGSSLFFVALAAIFLVRDKPAIVEQELQEARSEDPTDGVRRIPLGRSLSLVISNPASWLGFFIHSTMMTQNLLTLLWGVPLVTLGMGGSSAQAGLMLTLNTVVIIISSPLHGVLSSRLGNKRAWWILFGMLGITAAWIIFFLPATPRSIGAIMVVNTLQAAITPMSSFAFDFVRENTDTAVMATGTGVANMGGFVFTMLGAQVMGIAMDHSAVGGNYTWLDFRHGWLLALCLWIISFAGFILFWIWCRRRGGSGVRVINQEPPR